MNCWLTITEEELLTRWRVRRGWEPLPVESAAAERDERLERMLLDEMRGWYARQIALAPVEELPVEDFSSEIPPLTEAVDSDDGVEVRVPGDCIRVTGVKLAGWNKMALPITGQLDFNPYCAPDVNNPRAIDCGGGVLRLYPAIGGLSAMLGVRNPVATGVYKLTGSMLSAL